jgi:hypothetical protein
MSRDEIDQAGMAPLAIFKRVGRGIAAAISEKLSVELWARALARRAYGPSPQPSSSSALSRSRRLSRVDRAEAINRTALAVICR